MDTKKTEFMDHMDIWQNSQDKEVPAPASTFSFSPMPSKNVSKNGLILTLLIHEAMVNSLWNNLIFR